MTAVVSTGQVWDVTDHRVTDPRDPYHGTIRYVVTSAAGSAFGMAIAGWSGDDDVDLTVNLEDAARTETGNDGVLRLYSEPGQSPYLTLEPVSDPEPEPRTITDAQALDVIGEWLRDPDRGVEMLEDIAGQVSKTGRAVEPYADRRETWIRH